jgi:polyisoprenoid-binding protein YceI
LAAFVGCTNSGANSDSKFQNTLLEKVKKDIQNSAQGDFPWEGSQGGLPRRRLVSDQDHSSISFRTKHWEIVDIMGWFDDFEVVMYADSADFSDAVIKARVNPVSIKMPNLKMAGSAIQPPYLATESYPVASFESTFFLKKSDKTFDLRGRLTLNGIEKETSFKVLFNGFAYPGEQSICGFNITGAIDRHDFNIGTDDKLHSNRLIHADTVFLNMSIRME